MSSGPPVAERAQPATGTDRSGPAPVAAIGFAAVPARILALQGTVGNRATARALAGRSLARKEAPAHAGRLIGQLTLAQRRSLQEVTGVKDVPKPEKPTDGTKVGLHPAPEFQAGIPAEDRQPLTEVFVHLVHSWLSEPNTTCAIEVDLSAFGGTRSIWRFTHVAGAGGTRHLVDLITAQGALATPADEKMTKHGLTFEGTVSDDFKAVVLQAVELIPDSMLTSIDGVKFARADAAATDPADTAGNYDASIHTVTIFDIGMEPSQSRFDDAPGDAAPVDDRVRKVVHELGHAIDEASLARAFAALAAARAELVRDWSAWVTFDADGGMELDWSGLDAGTEKRLKGAIARYRTADKAVGAARSETGHGDREAEPVFDTAFKKAFDADGARPLTPYVGRKVDEFAAAKQAADDAKAAVPKATEATKDELKAAKDDLEAAKRAAIEARADILTEAYAEAFSLFVTEPETLRALRPSIYGFFRDRRAKLDKAAAAAAEKAGATP